VWQASVYGRYGAATLMASPNDTPVTSMADRSNDRGGLLWSLTHQRARHTAKAGFEVSAFGLDEQFSFAVTDPDAAEDAGLTDAAIAHDPAHPFLFAGHQHPSLWSMFVQDVYRASNRLTVNLGVRFDRSRLLIASSQWSPRAGVAYEPRPRTVLRTSAQRLFQPPQSEYLLLASSEEARELSPFESDEIGGGSDVPPERQTALDLSLSQDLSSHARVNLSVWRRRGRDVGDPNVFFGTTLTVPNSVARQQAWGFDARVDLVPYHGWSGALSYTHARVEQFGPFTGGLFLEEEVAEIQDGTRFTPDHDQRHAVSATLAFGDDRRR
jgi:outer membrane receptor protein involved in Fe transport